MLCLILRFILALGWLCNQYWPSRNVTGVTALASSLSTFKKISVEALEVKKVFVRRCPTFEG